MGEKERREIRRVSVSQLNQRISRDLRRDSLLKMSLQKQWERKRDGEIEKERWEEGGGGGGEYKIMQGFPRECEGVGTEVEILPDLSWLD